MLNPCICRSVCLQSCLTRKAVKASTNKSKVSYKTCNLLWYAKKRNLHGISVYFHKKLYLIWPPKLEHCCPNSLKIPPEQDSLL